MNARAVWTQWCVHRKSTAEIARLFKRNESEVDRIIARCMDCQFAKEPMPFERARI